MLCFFITYARGGTWGLAHSRQVLCHTETHPAPSFWKLNITVVDNIPNILGNISPSWNYFYRNNLLKREKIPVLMKNLIFTIFTGAGEKAQQ